MATETAIVPHIFTTTKIYSCYLMLVCDYKLNQMIFIRQIFFIYLMTNMFGKWFLYNLCISTFEIHREGVFTVSVK